MSSKKVDSSCQGDPGDTEEKGLSSGGSGEEDAGKTRDRPIREANPRDFIRIFTDYAIKTDIVFIMFGMVFALLSGIVSSIPAS